MSKIGLSSNTSGTATFTIASPATNTNRTLTLPDAAGTLNVSGLANEVPAGSAASPSIYPTGDNNTGIFFPAADTIAFAEGGAEVARFESNGNLNVASSITASRIDLTTTASIASNSSNNVVMSITNTNRTDQYLTLNMMGSNGFGVTGWADSGVIEAVAAGNATGTKALYLSAYNGPMFFATNNRAERMRITAAGLIQVNGTVTNITGTSQVTIAKNSPTAYNDAHLELVSGAGDVVLGFHAAGATAACLDHVRGTDYLRVVNAPRTAFVPIHALAFTVGSDYRIKENITPLTDAAARLMQIPVHRFSFIENSMSYKNGQMVDGFLAHEVEDIVPEAVFGSKDAVDENGEAVYQGIDQSKLVPLLTAALQEAMARIEILEARINALESQ
jgi:hypothetical protein